MKIYVDGNFSVKTVTWVNHDKISPILGLDFEITLRTKVNS